MTRPPMSSPVPRRRLPADLGGLAKRRRRLSDSVTCPVRLPEPQRLTYYAAIGVLGVLGVLEWPVALVLAGGHALASNQHNRAVQQFGDALEDA